MYHTEKPTENSKTIGQPIEKSQTSLVEGLHTETNEAKSDTTGSTLIGEGGNYWQIRYEKLLKDYDHLQKINQNLEEKLLNMAESFEKKREELVSNIEYEKNTLMADVDKLSTKLVNARIKLHDYEEKEIIHASECDSPCHKNFSEGPRNKSNGTKYDQPSMQSDPNLV